MCGGSQNTEGWCLHDRGRWERDAFSGWPNWIEKCEHNCCNDCTRDCKCPLSHLPSLHPWHQPLTAPAQHEGLPGTGSFQVEVLSPGGSHGKNSTRTGHKRASSSKKGTTGTKGGRKSKRASGPEDVPLPSIEPDDKGYHGEAGAEEASSTRKGKEKMTSSKPASSSNKRRK